jgi:hypothetical protein
MHRLVPASLLLSLLFSLPVFAAYKCESDGKTTYSDIPCPSGKQIEISGKSTIDEQNAERAKQQVKQERAELARLEKERHKREAAEEKQTRIAARNAATKANRCATLAQRVKWSEEDAAHTAGKSAEKAKRKARRAAESYELQCK